VHHLRPCRAHAQDSMCGRIPFQGRIGWDADRLHPVALATGTALEPLRSFVIRDLAPAVLGPFGSVVLAPRPSAPPPAEPPLEARAARADDVAGAEAAGAAAIAITGAATVASEASPGAPEDFPAPAEGVGQGAAEALVLTPTPNACATADGAPEWRIKAKLGKAVAEVGGLDPLAAGGVGRLVEGACLALHASGALPGIGPESPPPSLHRVKLLFKGALGDFSLPLCATALKDGCTATVMLAPK